MERTQIDENLEYLIRCILTLETPEECLHFLEDICTPSELFEMSRRLQAAKMLQSNVNYSEIAKQTGLSTATISRVNRCLKFDRSGYQTVLKRTAHKK
ncbi:MAG: helix-turn-helix domain-containing protein [Clostridia bacterium]|nr:helix-turn-helix domain-containing protein [Clostridia bacterium]